MTRKYFGTDGVRGTANVPPITPDTVLRLSMAAGQRFRRGGHRHRVVVGKDTRLSGYMLQPAMTAGFTAMGMDVQLLGPMPTPAVAMLTRSLRADLGVMISASHNPYQDNGIKLFGPDGFKLSDDEEHEIEALMERDDLSLIEPAHLGRARQLDDAPGRYIEAVKKTFPRGMTLDGLKIVVDCANGAAYRVAPSVFWELGAEVIAMGVSPNGKNINDGCGATNPAALSKKVVNRRADLGIALDGDADRLIVVDENGMVVDGDQVMALIARWWNSTGRLTDGVVGTVMSNLGLERFLGELGLPLIRTRVGDRYVVEQMRADGYKLGGEQSGHIIMTDYTTTGDGLIAALQVLAVLVERRGATMSELARAFEPVPQRLHNIRHNGGNPLEAPAVKEAIAAAENELAAAGRLVIRRSGTEPVIRVMAEGDDAALVEQVIERVTGAIESAAR